jgi:FkbM family methyltransferase
MFISYAQNYEDVMLFRALKNINQGFYVDVGAMDPICDSVTKAFYDRGWRGINIEPVKYWHEKLEQERPEDINLNVAVFDKPGILKLYDIPDTGLTTFDKETAARHAEEREYKFKEITVPALTLDDILKDHSGDIHFLKIDVECAEKQALLGIDLKKNRPWIILVEATKPNSRELNYQDWESIIINEGYQFVYFDGLNRFYLAEEKRDLAQTFNAPPNVFDNFIRAEQFNIKTNLADKENQIKTLQSDLADKNNQIEMLHSNLADKENQIETLQSDLASKDNQIQTLQSDLAEKENQIETLQSDLASKDNQIQTLQSDLADKDNRIKLLSSEIEQKTIANNALSAELDEIKCSKSWKLAMFFRHVRYKLAPPESLPAKFIRKTKGWFESMTTKLRRRWHYIKYKKVIEESGLFDREWYLSQYPDVAEANIDPLKHYIAHGGFEGRDPSPKFSSSWYLNSYQDVKEAEVNPLIHYLKFGKKEGRVPIGMYIHGHEFGTSVKTTGDTANLTPRARQIYLDLKNAIEKDREAT